MGFINSMQIFSIQNYSNNSYSLKSKSQPTFEKGGKTLTLEYIVSKHEKLIPERVLLKAKEVLAKTWQKKPTLIDIHKETYAPLLSCNTLDEAKALFPEFSEMAEKVVYKRKSRFAKEFKERTDENFALKMLQEFWAKLKTKEEIAQDFGMTSRTTLEWPLEQIGFVSYPSNYKTILRASDPEGNKIITGKTKLYNQLHPDLMYAHNKKAAQACKTPEYREAQRQRMLEYDSKHPERIQKISEHSTIMWQEAAEVRKEMSEYITKNEPIEVRRIFAKKIKGIPLRAAEYRMVRGAYSRFWEANPQLRQNLSEASLRASKIRGVKK